MDAGSKTEQIKKSELLKELHQMKLKIQNLEREKTTHIYNKHGDYYKDFGPLQELENKLATERKTEKVHLQQQLTRISGMVKKFQRELKDVRPTPEFVEKLKVIMEEIEGHISEYKLKQREQYEEMMREERVTSQEVAALDKKFESWSQMVAPLDTEPPARMGGVLLSHRDTPRDLPPEVKTFDRFVAQSGGPRGGWDEYDHGTFLKFRNRHKGKLSFLRELTGSLPTRTAAETREHEEWYQQYLSLNDQKKEAIQRWKERKENEKDEVLSKAEKDEQKDFKARRHEEEAKQRALGLDQHEQRAQLNKWKVEKELEKAQEEQKKLRQQLEKAKQEAAWQQRQEEQRRQVEEYKQVRQQADDEARQQKLLQDRIEAEEKQRQAAELITKYRERDLAMVKKKKAEEEARQQAADERRQRVAQRLRDQASAGVPRDPSRLLQPTAGWRERQKDPGPQGGAPVLHMPHRAVPSWRQGLH